MNSVLVMLAIQIALVIHYRAKLAPRAKNLMQKIRLQLKGGSGCSNSECTGCETSTSVRRQSPHVEKAEKADEAEKAPHVSAPAPVASVEKSDVLGEVRGEGLPVGNVEPSQTPSLVDAEVTPSSSSASNEPAAIPETPVEDMNAIGAFAKKRKVARCADACCAPAAK